ncbi:hypothetical protein CC80DRAFT_390775, partial [Byssothecium circinans]
IDLDRLFDQYVETDLFQQHSNDTATEGPSSDDIAHLFELPSSNGGDPFKTQTLPDWETSIENSSWHKAANHTFEQQNPASSDFRPNSSFVYPQSCGKASLSDPELFSFDDLFDLDADEPRAISQPSSPVPRITRPNRKPTSSPNRSNRHGVLKTTKRSTIANIASKMMNPSHYRTGFQDLWTRKMDAAPDTFNLQIPSNGLHSPPPSTKLMQDEHGNGFYSRDQTYTIAMSPPLHGDATSSDVHSSNYQLTPLASPAIDINNAKDNGTANPFQFSNDGMANAYISHHLSHEALSALRTPPPTQRLPMGAWGTDTLHNLDFGDFSASPDFHSHDHSKNNGGWWNGNGASQPSTPNTHAFHTNHSRSSRQDLDFIHDGNSTPVTGLGISCDTASFPGFGSDLSSSHHGGTNANSMGTTGLPTSASSYEMPSYALYQPSTPGIPIGTRPARGPSRSPSLSPQPRFTRRRHSQNPHNPHSHQHHHSRHASNASRRKSSSTSMSSHPRAASTGNVGFVNFTPSDSRKILTGVAPSGSSKTKARREKEAADKRRKLSQAAVKAVLDAGGDLGRL